MSEKLNILDRAKSYFSPSAAYEIAQLRHAASIFGGGLYDGATPTPHYDVQNWDTDEDENIRDLPTLRATSKDKSRNNGFYKGVIQCSVEHVIGSGLKAKSTIQRRLIPNLSEERAKEIESMFDDYFNSWAESTICDITAKDNFAAVQALAYKSYKRDGDSFATLPLTKVGNSKVIQIDLIGASNIQSNKVDFIEGIKVSSNKMPIKYSILQSDSSFKEINAFSKGKRNMLHVFQREEAKQVRGIPFLAPVMRDIDSIDEYMKHELIAAKLSAIFFGSITSKSKDGAFGAPETDLLTGKQTQTTKNTVKENSITQLHPDDELNIHQQGRDNPNFESYIKTNLQKVSTQTRIPLEVIMAQFVSSYSASRAAMLLMQKFINPERKLFVTSFCKPTRDQVITWGILQGDLVVPDFFENRAAYLKAMWIGDPMGSVDPQKDVKAKIMAIDNNLTTKEQATVDLGNGDFETNVSIRDKEIELESPLIKKVNKANSSGLNNEGDAT